MRISAKADYAVRAMAELAARGAATPVKAEAIANAQQIPLKFLLGIMNELKRAHLVRSQRGIDGGFTLSEPPDQISVADVIRAIDGPLANVHDASLSQLEYEGAAASLRDVWMAVRGSLRAVLEPVTLADLVSGRLPAATRRMASAYEQAARS